MPVTVIGDATMDVTVRPTAAPRAGGDVPARISISPGGQGANVAVRLARAGTEVRLATAIADDAAGRLLRAALEADGVVTARLAAAGSGLVVSLLDDDGERTMLSDRVSLDASAVAAACAGAEWVHCSGYPLADDASGDLLADVLGSLPSSTRISAGGGSLPRDEERSARVRRRLTAAGVDLLCVNQDEAAALLDRPLPSLAAAADAVAAHFSGLIAIVTGAAAGSVAAGPGFAISVPAVGVATPVLDSTGAGDAYVAALIALLVRADWPPDLATLRAAMERGSAAGALVSRVLGAQGRTVAEPQAR
jgi:ribokinase